MRHALCIAAICMLPCTAEAFTENAKAWSSKDNGKITFAEENGKKVLSFYTEYGAAAYSWFKLDLSEKIDASKYNAIRFEVKSPGDADMSISVVYREKAEVKYSTKVSLSPIWTTVTVPFANFEVRNGTGISAELLARVEYIMFSVTTAGDKSSLSMAAVRFVQDDTVKKKEGRTIAVTEKHATDLATIKERLVETLSPSHDDKTNELSASVVKIAESMQADGSFPGIKYEDRSRTRWDPQKHLSNLYAMTLAYIRLVDTDATHEVRTSLKKKIDSVLAYWIKRDPESDNWWHNEIGAQLDLTKIALLLDDELTDGERTGIIAILKRSVPDRMTGGNLTWTAGHTVVRGVIERSPAVAARAFDLIANEIRIASGKEEGVKSDGTFHQHGQQIYNSGYGAVYSVDASRFLYYAAGTAFEFPKEKIDVLNTYVLDGSRWMLYRNVMDYSVRGREITRVVGDYRMSFLTEVCKNLKTQASARQAETAAFYDELMNRNNSLVGNKHFWISDYMTHRRPDWMISVKMISKRMQSGELVNDEGQKSHLLSDGLTYIYSGSGLAYHNIFPIWDWRRLPGITAEWADAKPDGPVPTRGGSEYAGGISDGTFGAAAFILKRKGLSAYKAYFFFDKEMVALGAGITCDTDKPVYTSLEQCLSSGDAVVSEKGNTRDMSKGKGTMTGPGWVHQNGVGYYLPDGSMTVKALAQTGSWKGISTSASGDAVTADVFSAWIDHGTAPKDASYQYIVVPAARDAFMQYVSSVPVRVIANSADVQAVEHPSATAAVFYKDGGMTAQDGLSVTVDNPCLLMLRKGTGYMAITAANPYNKPLTLGVTVNKKLSGTGAVWERSLSLTRIRITLPDADAAGKSITVRFVLQ
ncbi:MAG: polysaccharide lyase 8 family protein [Spirochaetota bacterium]